MLADADKLRIIAFLKRFGCNRNETLTYIEVLISGTTSIQELARNLKVNRISVHYSAQQLVKKGFLFEIRKGKKRFIAAENPDVLLKMIRERHTELKSLETDVGYISQLLNAIPVVKQEITVVKLYEEIEGFKKMLEESLEAKNEIMVFSNTPIFSKILGEEYYEKYFAKKAAMGINSRIIYSPCAFADKLNTNKDLYKIDLRILPKNEGSEAGFYLWNNTLAIETVKEKKISCTIIENKDIANLFRENIFNHFWKEAKIYE
jgi:sugar-specific transcriptional regulator TrmB